MLRRNHDKSGAVSIDIRGAKGPNAITINGVYEPTDEVCSNWPVYRKRGDPTKWLEFFSASNKWYIKATGDKGRARGWMRLTADPPTRPELCKSICEVWDGSKWTAQPTVSIMSAKQRREEDKRIGAERFAQSVPVDIRGSFGPSASSINGIYEPTTEVSGGWPVYRKQGDPDKWLEYIVATGEWYVKPTADRGRAEGWMCMAADPGTRPELCRGTCEVWDGERWTMQSTVTVLTASSGFESLLDVQIFCARELRGLQERLGNTVKRSLNILGTVSEERARNGNLQLDQIIEDMDNQLKKLLESKAKEQASSSTSSQGSPSDLDGVHHIVSRHNLAVFNHHHRKALHHHAQNYGHHNPSNKKSMYVAEIGGEEELNENAPSETDIDHDQLSSEDMDDDDEDDDEDGDDLIDDEDDNIEDEYEIITAGAQQLTTNGTKLSATLPAFNNSLHSKGKAPIHVAAASASGATSTGASASAASSAPSNPSSKTGSSRKSKAKSSSR